MTKQQQDAFTTLRQRWVHHEALRSSGASISELAASRWSLDAARDNARTLTR